jgi:hypothetical protein
MMAITKEVQLELGLEAWDPEQQAAHPRIHPPLRGLRARSLSWLGLAQGTKAKPALVRLLMRRERKGESSVVD